MTYYDIADRVKLQVSFVDSSGAHADPDEVTLKIKTPSGTTSYVYGVDADVIRESAGVYYYLLLLGEAGKHVYRWEGVGTLYAGGEKDLVTNASEFYP